MGSAVHGAPRVGSPASAGSAAASTQRHRYGAELSSARAALVALVAGGALAVTAVRAAELLVVVAVVQAAFVLAWVFGAAVAVVPGESFDGPEGEVELGPTPTLLGSPDPDPAGTADEPANAGHLDVPALQPPAPQPAAYAPAPAAAAMPGRIGAVIIGAATAVAADYAVMRWPHSALSPMLGILGLAVPVMFAHQLTRGVVRARVVESLSGIALVVAAVVALPALVQLRHEVGGGYLVAATTLAGGVAVALGLLVDLVWPRPRFDPDVPRGLSGVALGTAAGAGIGAYLLRHEPQFTTAQAVLYCAGIAAVSALVGVASSLVGYSSPAAGSLPGRARLLRPVALALLPLMLVAPAAYVLLVSA